MRSAARRKSSPAMASRRGDEPVPRVYKLNKTLILRSERAARASRRMDKGAPASILRDARLRRAPQDEVGDARLRRAPQDEVGDARLRRAPQDEVGEDYKQ